MNAAKKTTDPIAEVIEFWGMLRDLPSVEGHPYLMELRKENLVAAANLLIERILEYVEYVRNNPVRDVFEDALLIRRRLNWVQDLEELKQRWEEEIREIKEAKEASDI